jgi:hypothetical protein
MREDMAGKESERSNAESVISSYRDEAASKDTARAEELNELYRPLTEAVEARLKKTKAGRHLLEETGALVTELEEVASRHESSREAHEEVRLALGGRLMSFRERHQEQLIEAHAPHARLRPSVEAVAEIVRPELANTTSWVAEASPSGAMLLERKRTNQPEQVDTSQQGLGDPEPFAACISPPFTRREDYAIAAPPGDAMAESIIDGNLWHGGTVIEGIYIPMASIATSWVGHDFTVPEGLLEFEVSVDYSYTFSGGALVNGGVAVINEDVAIGADNLDGTFTTSAESVCTMIVPTWAADSFFRPGHAKVTLTVPRATLGSERTVRVMVGADGHTFAMALGAISDFGGGYGWPSVTVHEICIRATKLR